MSTEQPKAIPEELLEKVYAERVRRYPPKRHNGANSMKSIAFDLGAEFVYDLVSPEIEALKAERDAYRKALEEPCGKGMFGYVNDDGAATLAIMAKKALNQYPSPSKDKDNG